jgi:hypothetical protein
LRRHATTGRDTLAGSGQWLDPFALPLRFLRPDISADARVRVVDLHRERVVVRRALRGMRMALNVPVSCFLGVVIRIEPAAAGAAAVAAVVLEHHDPALSLTLCRAHDPGEAVGEWQSWGRALGLPLLVADADGQLHEPFPRVGALCTGIPCARRRSRSAVAARRPSLSLRRRAGALRVPLVHRGEREMIARN